MGKAEAGVLPSPVLLLLAVTVAAGMLTTELGMALEGVPPPVNCTRSCGGKSVPYPFGLDDDSEDCYLSDSFSLTCNYSYSPPKTFWGDFEVLDVILPSGRMRVLMEISYDCYTSSDDADAYTWDVSLYDGFTLSYEENLFMAVGCDTMAKFRIGHNRYSGCMTGCNSLKDVGIEDAQCLGIGCCQTHISERIDFYETQWVYRDNSSTIYRFNNCSYSFMVEKNNYTFRKSDLQYMDLNTKFPMILDWFIGDQPCEEAVKNRSSYACVSNQSECFNSKNGPGYICNCSQGYQGNPYLEDGCQDIDECKLDRKLYPCNGTCVNTRGSYICTCPDGFNLDDSGTICAPTRSTTSTGHSIPRSVIVVIGIGSALAFLIILGLTFYLFFQRRKIKDLRREYFERNGGTLLQQKLRGERTSFRIFSMEELKKATDNFDRKKMIGQGGFGIVYRGRIDNGEVIAIKKAKFADARNRRDTANEIFLHSKIDHKNIVKLLGCCLEDEVPLLAYEFIPRGTLQDYIHSPNRPPRPFGARLRIAAEAAEALAYLHTPDVDKPLVLHSDVKSSNILLDEHETAKVSDFGTSRFAEEDGTRLATMIRGTLGYLDPEYLINNYLSDKSDVFSFGVVLVELLTGRLPYNSHGLNEERNLYYSFALCAKSNRLGEILDPEIVGGGISPEVGKVAEIALRCISVRGEERPTMEEVARELGSIEGVRTHPWLQGEFSPEAEQHLLGGGVATGGATPVAGTSSLQVLSIESSGGR